VEMLFIAYGWMSAEYSYFALDGEAQNYTIHIDGYTGDCGNAMMYDPPGPFYHNGRPFTTRDVNYDPDNQYPYNNCAVTEHGGWWYDACFVCLLTGSIPYNVAWWTMPNRLVNVSRMMIKQTYK